MEKKPCLAILNITSWSGLCADAEHVYGSLLVCSNPDINVDNVEEYCISTCRPKYELYKELTLEQAELLDKKDGGHSNKRAWQRGCKTTTRFDTFKEVEQAGINKWQELKLSCPFISLYEGEKYGETITLMPGSR